MGTPSMPVLRPFRKELVIRTPGYFQKYFARQRMDGKPVTTNFSQAVYTQFHRLAASLVDGKASHNGVREFLQFLRNVDKNAYEVLPLG